MFFSPSNPNKQHNLGRLSLQGLGFVRVVIEWQIFKSRSNLLPRIELGTSFSLKHTKCLQQYGNNNHFCCNLGPIQQGKCCAGKSSICIIRIKGRDRRVPDVTLCTLCEAKNQHLNWKIVRKKNSLSTLVKENFYIYIKCLCILTLIFLKW